VDYCRTHKIALTFVIPPEQMDAQRRISELGVNDSFQRFKSDLAQLAPVYDCAIESSITSDRANYSDPFHLENEAAARLVGELWTKHPADCRVLGAPIQSAPLAH
jgi:hypothetical protein